MPDKTMSPHSPAYIPAGQRQNSFMKDDVLRTKSNFGYAGHYKQIRCYVKNIHKRGPLE